MSHAPVDDAHSHLSDNDIENLFLIVERSYRSPGSPFGEALFEAYYSLIAEKEIVREDADKYFKFLVRMASGRADTDTPAIRFKNLLASQGIDVDFAIDETGLGDITSQTVQNGHQEPFSDVEDQTGALASRPQSQSTSSPSVSDHDWHHHSSGAVKRSAQSTRRFSDPSGTRTHAVAEWQQSGTAQQRRWVSDHVPLLAVGGQHHDEKPIPTYENTAAHPRRAFSDTGIDLSYRNEPIQMNPLDAIIAFQPTETQLLEEADVFAYHHSIRLIRQVVWHWRARAQDALARRRSMSQKADVFRGMITARHVAVVFTSLARAAATNRSKAQAFAVQEAEIDRERNLHLMDKAFGHWCAYTQEHVQRTAVARRHVLRSKYFSAWKNFTVVTELKVRQHRLKTFFTKWKRLAKAQRLNEYLAEDSWRLSLLKAAWLKLGRELLDRKADAVASIRLERRFFNHWALSTSKRIQAEFEANEQLARRTKKKTWNEMRSKFAGLQSLQRRAQAFLATQPMKTCLKGLRGSTRMAPSFRKMTSKVDSRLVNDCLHQLWLRAQQIQQAAEVYRRSILHAAVTAWDHRLRCLWLSRRIDDRLMIQTLYRLSIASKASLFQRVQNYKLVARHFGSWAAHRRSREQQITGAEAVFADKRKRLCVKAAWGSFRAAHESRTKDLAVATQHDWTRLVSKVLKSWRGQVADIKLMDEQASAARFYVLTTQTLRKWRAANLASKKLKRREAYAMVRRVCKMNLARSLLNKWRDRAEAVRRCTQQAAERAENKTLDFLVATLHTWRERTSRLTELSSRAETYRTSMLLHSSLGKLLERQQALQDMAARLQPYQAELAAVAAQRAFTKLSWRLFQLRRLEQNASALEEKHWRSHVRSMWKFWAERAVASRLARRDRATANVPPAAAQPGLNRNFLAAAGAAMQPADSRSSATLNDADLDLDADADLDLGHRVPETGQLVPRSRGWAGKLPLRPVGQMREDGGTQSAATPLPGYLRTPSKRTAARSKMREARLLSMSERRRFVTPARGVLSGGMEAPALDEEEGEEEVEDSMVGEWGRAGTAPAGLYGAGAGVAGRRLVAVGRGERGVVDVGSVTPFEKRLRAQGFGLRVSTGGVVAGTPGRAPGRTTGREGLAGFEHGEEVGTTREELSSSSA